MSISRALRAGVVCAAAFLAACGGGGGGGNSAPPANQVPVANAGPDQTVAGGAAVNLDGAASTDADGTIAAFAWARVSGPAITLSNASTATPSFTAPAGPATIVVRLTVTDNGGATDTDDVTVLVNAPANQAPVAKAGADQAVASGAAVNLNGAASADADGAIASFAWARVSGPAITLSNASTATPSFTAPAGPATIVLRLTVTDDDGASDTDDVQVTVSAPPGGNVTVSGRVTFDRVPHDASNGLDYSAVAQAPARGVTVQAINSATSAVITSAVTDASGNYALVVPQSTVMLVRVRAEMRRTGAAPNWNFTVVDNTNGNALYTVAGTVFNSGTTNLTRNLNAPSGFNAAGDVTGPRSAGPFAILDAMFSAFNKVLAVDATAVFAPLRAGWSVNNIPSGGGGGGGQPCSTNGQIGTSFYTSGETCILGAANSDTDEYDGHVIIHEWGHYFEDNFSRSDSIGGSHGGGDRLDMRVAFGEGWGNAWSGIATDDPFYRDSFGNRQQSGFSINVEGNNTGAANNGWYSESSVQSILYDLYDAAADGADNLSLGFGPLYQVLRNEQRTNVPLTSIFSFVAELKADQAGSAAAINAIVNAQSINGTGIDAFGSAETNSAGSADVLPVYAQATVNGAAVNVCSTNAFDLYNKLSVRRFVRFNVTTAGVHTFAATGTASDDAVMFLYRGTQIGPVHDAVGPPTRTESFTQNLNLGEHVLEVAEFANLDQPPAVPHRACFNVTITR